jgi:hypothetical protein
MAGGGAGSCTSPRWPERRRCPPSAVRRGCEAHPTADWHATSSESDPGPPAGRVADPCGDGSSTSRTVGGRDGATRCGRRLHDGQRSPPVQPDPTTARPRASDREWTGALAENGSAPGRAVGAAQRGVPTARNMTWIMAIADDLRGRWPQLQSGQMSTGFSVGTRWSTCASAWNGLNST